MRMLEFYILDTGYLLTDKNNVVAASTMATRSNPYNATVIPAHDWDLFQTLKKAPFCHK